MGGMDSGRVVTANDQLMAVWATWILFATILVWTASGGSGGPETPEHTRAAAEASSLRYVIYSLPLTLGGAYWLSFAGDRPRIDERARSALVIYVVLALTGMAANSWTDFYAFRDLTIVSSYLLLFVFWFRAPAGALDICLAAIAACMGVEAVTRIGPDATLMNADNLYALVGLANPTGVPVFGPHSLLESTLGFPLGLFVLNYVYHRRWRLALVAGLLQLIAFKRISFVGVVIALAFHLVTRRATFSRAKRLGVVAVVGLSLVAMVSVIIFEYSADALRLENSSANAISLGRYDIAVTLWNRLGAASPVQWLIGLGPGAADAVSHEVADLNPHNDWLKVLVDYGVIGTILVHRIFFLMFVRHPLGLMIYLYTAVLMVTDNVFIYLYYHAFIALMMCTKRE